MRIWMKTRMRMQMLIVNMCDIGAENEKENIEESGTSVQLPITSYPCQWKPPCIRKKSNMKLSEAVFEKHMYGRTKKVKKLEIEGFDPWPVKYRGTAKACLDRYVSSKCGRGLGVSILLDPKAQVWTDHEQSCSIQTSLPVLPTTTDLKFTILQFKESMCVSSAQASEIEALNCVVQCEKISINGFSFWRNLLP